MYIKTFNKKVGKKTYTYQYLVRSQRVGKNVVSRILSPLGNVADTTSLAFYIKTLHRQFTTPVKIRQAKLYTLPMAMNLIIDKTLVLSDFIKQILPKTVTTNVSLLTKLMIIGRMINPDSKLSLTRWYRHLYLPEIFPKEIDVHQFYKTLDYLMDHKEKIEQHLFYQLKDQGLINATVIFYDLTSSYFEGEDCDIASYGYSRDHRPDRIQVTLGFVIDQSGLPLYHEVFEGNMLDQKTVKGILEKVKVTLGIQKVLFVADKGMLTEENVEELEKTGYTYILSQSIRTGYEDHKKYLSQKNSWIQLTETLSYRQTPQGILCYNPETAKHAVATREKNLVRLTDFIAKELAKTTQEKRKQNPQTIHDRIIKKLHSSHMSKYFDPKDTFKRKEDIIAKEEQLDGVWVLTTNSMTMTPEQIIASYKQEATIEASFKVIKDVIELRPIYHYNTNHVRGHIFICVLAYLVTKLLEKKSGQTLKKLKEQYMTSVILPEGNQKEIIPSFLQTLAE